MTDPIPFKAADGEKTVERRQLAEEARELLDNKAFCAATLALRQRWHAEQMVAHNRETMADLALKMQALEAIPQQLQILINDQKMAEARKR